MPGLDPPRPIIYNHRTGVERYILAVPRHLETTRLLRHGYIICNERNAHTKPLNLPSAIVLCASVGSKTSDAARRDGTRRAF